MTKTNLYGMLAVLATALLSVGLLVVVKPAEAAFPGTNGKIAFVSFRDGNREIYTMNSDGTSPARLTKNSVSDLYPAYSPDGKKIAFRSGRDGNLEIYTMNAGGGSQTRLTFNEAADTTPSWQPLP